MIELLKFKRIDLIKKLINYPNLQTRLYAIDALIYNDHEIKSKIEVYIKKIKERDKQIDSLSKVSKADKSEIEYLSYQTKIDQDYVGQLRNELLTKSQWQLIYRIRDSKQIVLTCGNAGSYKSYETPINELLSEKAIADIPKQYEELKSLDYFR